MTIMSHLKDLKDDFHSDTVLSILNEQRIRGVLCDVTIIVEDTKFKAHSNVLAASSLYFKNIFLSRAVCISGHVLELDDLKAEVFTDILNYIYSSTVVVKKQETVLDLAAAGKKLGISFLEDLTEKRLSNSPCPFSFFSPEKSDVKEEKRLEETAITNGPRITNAYSIFETENSNNLFSPLDLRASFKKNPETNKAPSISLDKNSACKDVEPASTLAEHSYAVTTGCDSSQRNSFYHHENNPVCKMSEDDSEALQSMPLVESEMQTYSTPKAVYNSEVTDIPTVKISNHKGPSVEGHPKVVNDHTISFHKSHPNTVFSTKEDENKSDHISGSVVTVIPPVYICNCCTKSFNDGTQFRTHLELHSQPQEPLVCKYCSKQIESATGLKAHEQVCRGLSTLYVESDNEQSCLDSFETSCGKNGTSYKNSESAMSENNLGDYSVTNCTMPETDHFVKVVDGQILYTCNVCKRTYVTLSSLRRHSNVHSWTRTYPCHYCNKIFALAEYRTRHEIWHTGERRYQCIFCLETFMTYYILKNHQKSFHAIDHRLGVNKKTANGGLKPSVYPYKLYRLLPMKCKRTSYKSYGKSPYESIQASMQVNEVPSRTCIVQNTAASELPSLNFSNKMLSNTTISLETSSCSDAIAAPANPPNSSSWEVGPFKSDPKNNSYTTERPLSSTELNSGPQEYDSSLLAFCSNNASENPTSAINYNNSASPVIVQSCRVSSVIMHSNAINAIGSSSTATSVVTTSQIASNDHVHGSDDSKSNARTRSNKEKKKIPLYDKEEISEELKYMANTGMSSDRPTDTFEPSSKTETYIAKPALPGTSADSNVAPLCQITVKIGNEAVVKRQILGSKLFYKKGRRSKYDSREDHTIQVAEREKRERSTSRVCRSDYIELSEMCDDVSDHDSNDKPWRPYYNYKPKKKSKQLRKMRNAKWREKYKSRNSCRESEKTCVTNYTLRNIPEEKIVNQDNGEMPGLHCELCERENSSTEEAQEHLHWDTTTSESYVCELCQKVFQNPPALRMHMQCHTGEKPYPCKTCGKSFSVSANLQKHECTHSGVNNFVCQYCNKTFTLNETLKIHERIHTGEKRYHCQFCFQSFLYLSTKRNHEQRHKREHSRKGFACFQCPKICKTAAALGMHQKKHLFKSPKQEDRKEYSFHESTNPYISQNFIGSDGQETAKPLLTQNVIDADGREAATIPNTTSDAGL
ncbi:zinc finger and BTB domain-containing protein 38 [Rhineura floridana]|uniref:zinc finger and BTB domain-containing protein 38 n=1 Tax=Rhineura floridana TaxID=261503 RepID=UPI002AC83E3F|nr:zinc finger and BTB domain-containing protein 38 [Rhineura floridana]XP_061492861.1 zinc finger and BTB domain-containing protein 38 [Rhineura floridana]XP_061492862.1 zinc finger and BTB domain-containing protein 38 [Rhineura floridana]XP_061492863.1 zinc finger and BTB domain-containing protein 38 [Rhineura floridana]XP_061492865.1 zinc finger and BTB domain-containing protein 38 [Rhineura floridana]XP_061492866.1 zinc finger and BTB domain-containing protein 38 [Rhineura floridana]